MDITNLLVSKYKFNLLLSISKRDIEDRLNQETCMIRLGEIHYLFYSEELKHFTLAVKNIDMKKLARGRLKDFERIMIPRPVYSEDDVKEVLSAFKINISAN